jgi:hypothetical protein
VKRLGSSGFTGRIETLDFVRVNLGVLEKMGI